MPRLSRLKLNYFRMSSLHGRCTTSVLMGRLQSSFSPKNSKSDIEKRSSRCFYGVLKSRA